MRATQRVAVFVLLIPALALGACGDEGSGGESSDAAETSVTVDPNAGTISQAELERRIVRTIEEALEQDPSCTFGPGYPSQVNAIANSEVLAASQEAGTTDLVVDPTESIGAQVIVPDEAAPRCLRIASRALAQGFPDGP